MLQFTNCVKFNFGKSYLPSDSHTYCNFWLLCLPVKMASKTVIRPMAQQKLRYHLMHIPRVLFLNETRFYMCCLHDNFASGVNLCGENFRISVVLRIVEKKTAKFEQNRNRKNFVPHGISSSSLILLSLLLLFFFSMSFFLDLSWPKHTLYWPNNSFGGLRLDRAGATGSSAGSPLGSFPFQSLVSSPGVIVL